MAEPPEMMAPAIDSGLRCPKCEYNLTGLAEVPHPLRFARGGGYGSVNDGSSYEEHSMPQHLRRCDSLGDIHFLTVSCYRRLPFFGTPEAREIVVQCMGEARDRLHFRWIGYVVMPEHVHWLCYPQTADEKLVPISSVLLSVKTAVGRRVKDYWRSVWAVRHTLGNPLLDHWTAMDTHEKPIWTTRGIDVNVNTQDKLLEKLDYCHHNPVKRGLAENGAGWAWSSYRFYVNQGEILLDMDWDGCWPLC